jgi:hypothetical protein
LEKIISYTRENKYIFLAQSVWWISSIIGLQQGLVIYIDNLEKRTEIGENKTTLQNPASKGKTALHHRRQEVSVTPREIQKDSRFKERINKVHPDRVSYIDNTDYDISDLDTNNPEIDKLLVILQDTEQFIQKSRNERKAFNKQKHLD